MSETAFILPRERALDMRSKVFISYANADYHRISKIREALEQEVANQLMSFWFDENIPHSEDWNSVIRENIENSNAFILVVSRGFLGSKFIMQWELPRIFHKQKTKSGVIYPFLLEACNYSAIEIHGIGLPSIQFAPVRSRTICPLERLDEDDQYEEVALLMKRIREQKALKQVALPKYAGSWWRDAVHWTTAQKASLLVKFVGNDVWARSPLVEFPIDMETQLNHAECRLIISRTQELLAEINKSKNSDLSIFNWDPGPYRLERTFWAEIELDLLSKPKVVMIALLLVAFDFSLLVDLQFRHIFPEEALR